MEPARLFSLRLNISSLIFIFLKIKYNNCELMKKEILEREIEIGKIKNTLVLKNLK